MTEIDVDLAIYAMSQAVEDLVAAAKDKNGRHHVAANRQRLIDEVGRLYDSLTAAKGLPGGRAQARLSPAADRSRDVASMRQRRVA